jgi:hypothetical protein
MWLLLHKHELAPMVSLLKVIKMKRIKTFFFLTLLAVTLYACGQTKNDSPLPNRLYAQQKLNSALNDKSQHNVIDNKTIFIKDSLTAISIAEPILFSVYGKDNIIGERPYKIYFIDNYWVINGTLPKDYLG